MCKRKGSPCVVIARILSNQAQSQIPHIQFHIQFQAFSNRVRQGVFSMRGANYLSSSLRKRHRDKFFYVRIFSQGEIPAIFLFVLWIIYVTGFGRLADFGGPSCGRLTCSLARGMRWLASAGLEKSRVFLRSEGDAWDGRQRRFRIPRRRRHPEMPHDSGEHQEYEGLGKNVAQAPSFTCNDQECVTRFVSCESEQWTVPTETEGKEIAVPEEISVWVQEPLRAKSLRLRENLLVHMERPQTE